MTVGTIARPGSEWANPIWYRNYRIYINDILTQSTQFDWCFVHDDYDGGYSDKSQDSRHGYGPTVEDCKKQIDEQIASGS